MDLLSNPNGSPSPLVLFEMIEEAIRSTFDKIVGTAMKRRDFLLAQLFDSKMDFLKKEKIRIERLEDIQSFINQINNFKINQSHALSLQKEYLLRVQKEIDNFQQPTPMSIARFRTNGLEHLQNEINEFGSIKQEQYLNRKHAINCFSQGERKNAEFTAVNGISLDSNQNIYIANLTQKRINIFSIQFEFIETFGSGILSKPHSIAIQNNFVFVTDIGSNSVHKFSIPIYNHVASSDTWCTNFPLGLTTDNNNIYISACNNNCVAVLSLDLTFQRDIGSTKLNDPRDVKLVDNQLFVVDNSSQYNVHSFLKSDGTFLRSFINLKNGSGHLFMCFDKLGNLIISDRLAKNIQVFNGAGQLVHIFPGSQYFGLAVTKNYRIICAMKSGNTTIIAMY